MTRLCLVVIVHFSILAFGTIVTVTTKGTIPTLPENLKKRLIVREGTKTYTITCPAEGIPPPIITWTKDGESITPAWTRFRKVNKDRDLRIKNVAMEDSGLYKCQAANGFGSVDLEYTVIVKGKNESPYEYNDFEEEDDENFSPSELEGATGRAPFWVKSDQIKEQTHSPILRSVGSSVRLKCLATGHPIPDIIWLKGNEQLDSDVLQQKQYSNIDNRNKWILHIKNLRSADAGKYTCKVVNMFGTLNATFNLELLDDMNAKPEFEKTLLNTSIPEGQTATFQCKVRSTVTPTIKWIKKLDEENYVEDNKTFVYEGKFFRVLEVNPPEPVSYPNNTYMKQLVILNVKPKDAGWYFCVVADTVGNIVNRSANLKVLPSVTTVQANETLPLHVVIGVPVALLLLMFVGYAVYFLQKHQQKPSSSTNQPRPQPPNYPPPSVPCGSNTSHKTASSPYRRSTPNGVVTAPLTSATATVMMNGKDHSSPYVNKDTYKAYHHLDPMASVPLNSQCPSVVNSNDLYEATPQPYELHLDHSEFSDCYDAGRIQHYPSLYSCR